MARLGRLFFAGLAMAAPAFAGVEAGSPMPADLMPKPAGIRFGSGNLAVTGGFTARVDGVQDARLDAAVSRLLDRWEARTGIRFPRHAAPPGPGAALVVECRSPGGPVPALGDDESYTLSVEPCRAILTAACPAGALRGIETLGQALTRGPDGFFVPGAVIDDRPRFPWRGLLIDVARHWMPPGVIRRNLDGMSLVKLNVLHLHLTDDQGFRIESLIHPELQGKGSDGLFYTQAQMRDIIAYARDRGIRVVPEFDLPGHATSWLVSHPELASQPGPYAIERRWGVHDPVLDPTNEALYRLLDDFLGEMAALFPDEFVHIGGDENNGVQWNANPGIQAFIRERGLKGDAGLHAYFNRRLAAILGRHGRRMVGWDEILGPDLPRDAVIQSWRGPRSLQEAVDSGREAILSSGYYLDLIRPAREYYRNDPIPAGSAIAPAERNRILGGEAAMWSEWVTAETIDSRIWPRAAAIAERLWSPRDSGGVDDMYRRLEAVGARLGEAGLLQEVNRAAMLRRLAGGSPDRAAWEALDTFVDVLEPVKDYRRADLQPLSVQSTPLAGVADAARPESRTAREFAAAVDLWLDQVREPGAPPPVGILRALDSWTASGRFVAEHLAAKYAALRDAAPLARALADAAASGRDAVDMLAEGRSPPRGWLERTDAILERAARPAAGAELAVVVPVRLLAAAAAGEIPRTAR
jgi:hexosaminidase